MWVIIIAVLAAAATVIVFFMIRSRKRSVRGRKICPECGESNLEDAIFCIKCGKKFRKETITCPHCKAVVQSGSLYCSNCGKKIETAPDFEEDGKTMMIHYATVCDYCGALATGDQAYCEKCGRPLREMIEDEDAEVTMLLGTDDGNTAFLEFFENGLVRRIHLNGEFTRIGSGDNGNDYVLPSSKVSRIHMEVHKVGGRFFIQDLNSTNGTYLNDANVKIEPGKEIEVRSGDRIRVADVELVLRC